MDASKTLKSGSEVVKKGVPAPVGSDFKKKLMDFLTRLEAKTDGLDIEVPDRRA